MMWGVCMQVALAFISSQLANSWLNHWEILVYKVLRSFSYGEAEQTMATSYGFKWTQIVVDALCSLTYLH